MAKLSAKSVRSTEVGGIFLAKSLIITEKPSVAQEFARILGVSGRNDGYIENSDYVITWCVGHLVEMVYPEVYDEKYKKWKLEDLPFLPKDYKYDVIPAVSRQYDVVHKMLHREDIDTVYWARLPISSLLKYSFFITIDTNERIRVLQVISVQQMKPLHANG